MLLALGLLLGRPALAVEPGATAAAAAPARETAESHVTEAKTLFQAREYGAAALELRRAYELEPRPLYLFNAGQAYRKGERYRDAQEMYQRFLSVDPDNPLAAEASGYVRDMGALLATQQRAEQIQLELQSQQAEKQQLAQQADEAKQKLADAEAARRRIAAELERAKKPPLYKSARLWAPIAAVVGLGLVLGASVGGAYGVLKSTGDAGYRVEVKF